MKCPFCAFQENKVIDSRLSKDGAVIRRRRECNDCSKRFTTYERIEEVMPQVIKRDGRREPFEHGTLLKSLEVACEKRPVPMARIENLVDELEKQLQDTGEKEIDSSLIVDEVLIRLSEVDDLAYVRYATRYRTYADLGELARELSDIVTQRNSQGHSTGQIPGKAAAEKRS